MRFRLGFLVLMLAGTVRAQDLSPYPALHPKPNPANIETAPPVVPDPAAGSRAWFSAEVFIAVTKKPDIPPLLRSIAAFQNGGMTTNGTTLYPDNSGRVDYGKVPGLRAQLGLWLDDEQSRGIELNGFVVEGKGPSRGFTNLPGAPTFLTRFYSDSNNGQNVNLFGDNTQGPVRAVGQLSIKPIFSTDLNYIIQGYSVLADRTDYLVGFRYYDQRENLSISLRQDFIGGGVLTLADSFATSNQFYGANFGIRSQFFPTKRIGADATFKIAAGDMYQRSNLNGSALVNIPGVPFFAAADGLYVRPTNSGVRDRHFFAVIPELNLRLNYSFTPHAKVFLGYDCVYVTSVLRPGQTIDPVVYSGNLQVVNQGGRVVGPNMGRPGVVIGGTEQVINALSLGFSLDF